MSTDERIQGALDQLYAEAPSAEAASTVLANLRALAASWEAAYWYGTLADSSIGPLLIAVSEKGVVAIEFGQDEQRFVRRLKRVTGNEVLHSQEEIDQVALQLREYLRGERRKFDLQIDLDMATEFQQSVLEAAALVPAGAVVTYGEIAQRIGKPRAARAVGQALARNPIPIVMPCHRVVAADGALTGYSGGDGIDTKAALLRLEGATIA